MAKKEPHVKPHRANRCLREQGSELRRTEESIVSSERKFRAAFENANDAIFLMQEDTFIDCNPKTLEMFGCTREEILQRTPYEFSPQQQDDGRDSKEKALEKINAALSGRPQFFEWKHKKLDGTLFDAEVSLNCLEIDGRPVVHAIVRDVTWRKKSEEELKRAYDELESRVDQRTFELKKSNELLEQEITQRREAQEALARSEAKYRELVESANSIVLEMDSRGNVIFFNNYAQEFFGFSESEILGRNVVGTIVPERDSSGSDLKSLIQDLLIDPEKYRSSENENMRKNGERVWVAWTNKAIYDLQANEHQILCIGIDRTEQKQVQERLAEELKEKAAASERDRLARDLHDAVSQTLFSTSLIAEVLPRLWERDQDEGRRRLEEIRLLSRSALAEMRTLLFELRPVALAEAELSDLLRQLVESITVQARVPVAIAIVGGIELPSEVKVAFYRIAQEALNNVAKHSGASEAKVSLDYQSNKVTLRVSDNGKGFDPAVVPLDSLGLGIMRDRACDAGIALKIESRRDAGTEIVAVWLKSFEEKH